MDKSAPEDPFRYSDYYSERENIGREQMGFSQGKEMKKTFYLARNREKVNCLRKNHIRLAGESLGLSV